MPNSPVSNKSSGLLLLILVSITTFSFVALPSIFVLIAAFIADLPLNSVLSAFRAVPAQPLYQNLYMLVQGLSSFVTFIVMPIFFVRYFEKESLNSYLNSKNLYLAALALIVPLALSLMMVNSIFIEWNMNIQLPSGLHEVFKRFEDQAKEATDFLTSFYSLTYFIFAFVVVAIIPAVGEELLFRGLIQKYMTGIVINPHVAIWLTAVFFSAFHMQFFGFVPRMILGAFFGYLFYFSGNIWYSIAAHFVNNGFTLIMLYLFQLNVTDLNIDSNESVPFETIALFFALGVILFILFVKQFQKSNNLGE